MQLKEGLISVIVPVYNAEKYLDRCITSILQQSYDKFELILIDDGSSDESLSICNVYSEKDSRVKVLHISNSGSAAARNKGLDVMSGEYLIFADADDWIDQGAFQTAIQAIQNMNDDVVFFSVFSGEKLNVEKAETIGLFNKEDVLKSILSGDTASYSDRGYYVDGLWAKIYRADYIQKNNIRFQEKLIRSQDTVFSLYTTELAKKITFNTYRFYHYEKNDDSICNNYSNKSVRVIPEVLRENDSFIEKFYSGNERFADANNKGIFPKLIEAEKNYFFHPANKKSVMERYREYKTLLCDPIVRSHIIAINSAGLTRNQRLKKVLYRYPMFFLFLLYSKIVKR